MIVLARIKRHFVMLGTFPIVKENLKWLKLHDFQILINHIHIGIVVVFLSLYNVSVLYFVISRAKSFAQYATGAFFFSITLTRLAFYLFLNSKKSHLSAIIADLEAIIQTSKF